MLETPTTSAAMMDSSSQHDTSATTITTTATTTTTAATTAAATPKIPPGRTYLESLLNKSMKIKISDGRTLIGQFLCTDRDKNIILGACQEYIGEPDSDDTEEPRLLGLAMVPGRHVVSMHVDMNDYMRGELETFLALSKSGQKEETREREEETVIGEAGCS